MIDLHNENCMEVLKNIPDNSVDLIVTDPPYRVTSRGCSGDMGGYWTSDIAKSGKIFDNNDISFSDYIPHFYRILKDGTHCYIMINNINLIEVLNVATNCGFKFIKSLIWDKGNKITGRWYMGCFEYILMFRKGDGRPINFPSTPDILSIPIKKLKNEDGSNMHDTEKPVELMKTLIINSTDEGQTVLDPFMGIGATGVASCATNRNFIGVEINEKYFDIAKDRIDNIALKEDLF